MIRFYKLSSGAYYDIASISTDLRSKRHLYTPFRVLEFFQSFIPLNYYLITFYANFRLTLKII